MSVLYNPRWRLAWSAGTALAAAALLGADWLLRRGGHAALAPSAAALWISVSLGAALGAAAALWERYLFGNRRGFLLAFHRAPLSERLRWRYQKTNLLVSGWLLLAVLALIGWCVHSGAFVLPALFALNAVQFAANSRSAGRFNEELQRRAGA
jgi:hypothetical protein